MIDMRTNEHSMFENANSNAKMTESQTSTDGQIKVPKKDDFMKYSNIEEESDYGDEQPLTYREALTVKAFNQLN